jgi:hypothetical protein
MEAKGKASFCQAGNFPYLNLSVGEIKVTRGDSSVLYLLAGQLSLVLKSMLLQDLMTVRNKKSGCSRYANRCKRRLETLFLRIPRGDEPGSMQLPLKRYGDGRLSGGTRFLSHNLSGSV